MLAPPHVPIRMYVVRTRIEAAELAHRVAALTAHPERTELCLLELILNAIEHGSLEIGGERKRELVLVGKLDEEVTRLQATPPYDRRVVRLETWVWPNGARFVIHDEGPGFSWRARAEHAPAPPGPNGHGLRLARAGSDALTFNERGNAVTADFRW